MQPNKQVDEQMAQYSMRQFHILSVFLRVIANITFSVIANDGVGKLCVVVTISTFKYFPSFEWSGS